MTLSISTAQIRVIAEQLSSYRADGRGAIIFDSRDSGNYATSSWDYQATMLETADPTGLALGMLLLEMIEATIQGSKVQLERILREPGFIEQLRTIQGMEAELLTGVGEPRARLLERLRTSLNAISPAFGTPGSREVTICLRDAVYSMDRGLSLRWLRCDSHRPPSHAPLYPEIRHFATLPDFIAALRTEIAFGAHLAQVENGKTVIGIKHPGHIAYLSSIKIARGSMSEDRAHNYLHAEHLDLDTPVERYPNWFGGHRPSQSSRNPVLIPRAAMTHISELARDQLLWLAMVVEMATQRMSDVDADQVVLTEVMTNALPRPAANAETALAAFHPNWRAAVLSIEHTFGALGLAPWESEFLRPALEGLTVDMLFRVSEAHLYGMSLSGHNIVPWKSESADVDERLENTHVCMSAASPSLAGTKDEIDAARQLVFGANLEAWLLAWGNMRFEQEWIAHQDWFRDRLVGNLPNALAAACATWHKPEYRRYHAIELYQRRPNRKSTYPMCFFNVKMPVTSVAHLYPRTSQDLVELLDLAGEAELPTFLRGWMREQSWTTSDINGHTNLSPHRTYARWRFCPVSERRKIMPNLFDATVMVNVASLPQELLAVIDAASLNPTLSIANQRI